MIEEAERFLKYYSRKRAESTVKGKRTDLKVFSEFLEDNDLDVMEFDWMDLEQFVWEQKQADYSNHTVRNRYSSVKMLYDFLEKDGVIDENPADQITIGEFAPRKNKREELAKEKRVWLSKNELNKLVEAAPQPVVRNRLLILFMYYTACRRSEVANIKIANMDLEERKARVNSPKTGKTITVRWQSDLDPLLETWLNEYRPAYVTADRSPYLFVTEQAEQVSPNHITRVIRETAEDAGIQKSLYVDKQGNDRRRVTSHALRHSFAVHWLQPPNKGSLEELKEILAHEDVTTTQIYTEIIEDQVDESYANHAPSLGYDTGKGQSQTCELCGEQNPKLLTHHTSYTPEETMDVCPSCHSKIHNSEEYAHLNPDDSRATAKEKGWTP